jgi:hypothetical protein
MIRKNYLTKILAVVGAVLVWFPILATLLTSLIGSVRSGGFRFDYLMPLELFPSVFLGCGLLLWAALRARVPHKFIGGGFAIIIALLVGGQSFAVVTGLASGETEPVGWVWTLVIASIVLYSLTLIELAVAGMFLLRDLFKPEHGGTTERAV